MYFHFVLFVSAHLYKVPHEFCSVILVRWKKKVKVISTQETPIGTKWSWNYGTAPMWKEPWHRQVLSEHEGGESESRKGP